MRYKTYIIRHREQSVVMSFKVSGQGQCTLDFRVEGMHKPCISNCRLLNLFVLAYVFFLNNIS